MGRMLTEQAQSYMRLGQYREGIALLCGILTPPPAPPLQGEGSNFLASSSSSSSSPSSLSSPSFPPSCLPGSALQIAITYSDKLGEAAAIGSLGDAYRLKGSVSFSGWGLGG